MLSEEQYAELEKHQDKFLYHMYVIYLRYDNKKKKLQQVANEAIRAREEKNKKKKEKEREWQKQMRK